MPSNADNVTAVARRAQAASKALDTASRTSAAKAAQLAKQALWSAPGAPHGLVAKRKVSVGYTITEAGGGFLVKVRWRGAVHLVDRDTKAHLIGRRMFVGTRGRGKRAQKGAALMSIFGLDATAHGGVIKIGENVRPFAHHPGTHGKHFFDKGRDSAFKQIPAANRVVMHNAVAAIYKG